VQATGGRTIPDVALVADPATGAWIADPYNLQGSNPFEVVGGTSLSAPAWAGMLALVNQGRAAGSEAPLNSASPTEAQQALYSLPQSDYNVINGGNNGYTAEAGYNLVTGLGTPVANLLVSDLVVYQGPGTVYPGAKVGPLQDATYSGGDTSGSSGQDVINVFDSLTVGSAGLDRTSIESSTARSAEAQEQVAATAMMVSKHAVAANATILVFGPFAAGATSQNVAGLSAQTAQQARAVAQGSSVLDGRFSADGAGSPSRVASDSFDAEDHWEPVSEARRAGGTSDLVLDDLVTGLMARVARKPEWSGSVPSISLRWQNGAPPVQFAAQTSAPGPAALPAGPLAGSERDRRAVDREGRLAEFLLVAGLCGFGAGVTNLRNQGAQTISSHPSRHSTGSSGENERNRLVPRSR
jgi:hypothetical protein